ncbi:MAG: hypothetical protein CVU56_05325 [Deltaproteobacteria bacterium HGW-Deltaproteobacteria-14]|jgi:uncharacterized protein (TIGR03382 family)|nr:MAG: hypothetical protein CVU56_05325 [Deltaproteobacteria bacterium HGW-Deltaproteobacteria-14]
MLRDVNMTPRLWSLPLLALALVAAHPGAHAEECGDVGAQGVCRDSKTLVWCAAGQLQEMVCPADEVCVVDARFGPGGAGCIATQYTDCGAITQAGECAGGDRAVVWCDANRVKARTCDAGTGCAWVADEGWYDCVPTRANAMSGEPTPPDDNGTETGGGDVIDPPDTSDGPDVTGGGPLPSLEKGGAVATGTYAGGGAGCAGGQLPVGGGLALFALALLWVLRRQRG